MPGIVGQGSQLTSQHGRNFPVSTDLASPCLVASVVSPSGRSKQAYLSRHPHALLLYVGRAPELESHQGAFIKDVFLLSC